MSAPITDCYACAGVKAEHSYRCIESVLPTVADDVAFWLESLADWLDMPASIDDRDLRVTGEGVQLSLAMVQEQLDRLVSR